MNKDQVRLNIFPKPYPPTETTELDPKACLAFTEKGALREIAKINIESKRLSMEIKPARAYLNSAFHRIAALNRQRHTLDLFIFEDKLRKLPRGLSGLSQSLGTTKPTVLSREDYVDWLETLSPQEMDSFRDYLDKRRPE